MKKLISIIIFISFFISNSNSQKSDDLQFSINFNAGFSLHTSNDQLINYFNYRGNSGIPVKLGFQLNSPKSLLSLTGFYHNLKLAPSNFRDVNYDYNYIENQNIDINLDYFYRIMLNNSFFRYYFGIEYNLYSVTQKESYVNVLYSTQSIRKSYDISLCNLSPALMIGLTIKKHDLRLKASYALVNYGARPDDNYVKQSGYKSEVNWKLYTLSHYRKYHLEFVYKFQVFQKINLLMEYSVLYHSHLSTNTYKYYQRSIMFGIEKSF